MLGGGEVEEGPRADEGDPPTHEAAERLEGGLGPSQGVDTGQGPARHGQNPFDRTRTEEQPVEARRIHGARGAERPEPVPREVDDRGRRIPVEPAVARELEKGRSAAAREPRVVAGQGRLFNARDRFPPDLPAGPRGLVEDHRPKTRLGEHPRGGHARGPGTDHEDRRPGAHQRSPSASSSTAVPATRGVVQARTLPPPERRIQQS